MTDEVFRFDDGASYERMMGRWSALVGEEFLAWISVPAGAYWLDIGCGNGAFTQQLLERCAPASVLALDPSPGQLAYARTRLPASAPVKWMEAGAMRLPVADGSADAAAMALVLFFVPEPALGVAEMVRAVRSGGTVAAYHWDILEGGFPFAAIGAEAQKIGIPPTLPPSVEASTLQASTALWRNAGLVNVRTCQFTVQRQFESFDDYWQSAATSNTLRKMFDSIPAERIDSLKLAVQSRLVAGEGPVSVSARANAVCGIKP